MLHAYISLVWLLGRLLNCLSFLCAAAACTQRWQKRKERKCPNKKTCTDSAVNHRCWCTRVVSFPVSRVPEQGSLGKKTSTSLIPRPRPAFHHLHARGEPGNEHYDVCTSSVLTFNTLLCWSLWVCSSLILCWYFCRSFWGEATVITFLTSIYGESQTFYLLVSVIKISVPMPYVSLIPRLSLRTNEISILYCKQRKAGWGLETRLAFHK